MGFLDRLSRAAPIAEQKNAGGAAVPTMGVLPTLGASPSATGLLVSQATAMSVSAVYACTTIRAQDVARCTPSLWRRDATGKRLRETAHPVAKILRDPNRQQTWFEYMEQQGVAYYLRGNSYAAIKRDLRGHLQELIPINPDAVLLLESWDGQLFYNVNRIGLWQIAMLREFPSSIAQEDIFHLRGLSFNALVGASTIGLARDAIGVAMGLEQQTARFMANGARPSMVLETEKTLSQQAASRLGVTMRNAFGGVQNAGGIPVLEDGVKAKPFELTSVDQQFIEQRNFQLAEAARFWRIPLHKLGLEQARGVNMVQLDQEYVGGVIMPDLERWEQKFAKTFNLQEQGLEIKFDETKLLRADIGTRYAANRIALGGQGWVSVDEVREGEGLPPADPEAEGTAAIMRPVNMASVGSDKTGTAADGAGHPLDSEGGVPGADHVSPDGGGGGEGA